MAYGRTTTRESQSVDKLADDLQKCVTLQETMKGVNDYWRRTDTCMGAPGITEEQAKKIDERIVKARYPWERLPFSDYDIKNNYAEIRRLEKRIAEITRNQEVGYSGWEFFCGRAVANTELNRLQLFFDEKPNEKERSQLKANGFKWAPTHGAWQRQLNDNAIYAANRLDFLRPLDGRSVLDHQPKAPERDTGAR